MKHRSPLPRAATAGLIALLMCGCGQTGPLYLPEIPAAPPAQTGAAATAATGNAQQPAHAVPPAPAATVPATGTR